MALSPFSQSGATDSRYPSLKQTPNESGSWNAFWRHAEMSLVSPVRNVPLRLGFLSRGHRRLLHPYWARRGPPASLPTLPKGAGDSSARGLTIRGGTQNAMGVPAAALA